MLLPDKKDRLISSVNRKNLSQMFINDFFNLIKIKILFCFKFSSQDYKIFSQNRSLNKSFDLSNLFGSSILNIKFIFYCRNFHSTDFLLFFKLRSCKNKIEVEKFASWKIQFKNLKNFLIEFIWSDAKKWKTGNQNWIKWRFSSRSTMEFYQQFFPFFGIFLPFLVSVGAQSTFSGTFSSTFTIFNKILRL